MQGLVEALRQNLPGAQLGSVVDQQQQAAVFDRLADLSDQLLAVVHHDLVAEVEPQQRKLLFERGVLLDQAIQGKAGVQQ